MKWGTLYAPDYVNNLKLGVSRHLKRPHRFVCFTDCEKGLDKDILIFPLPGINLPNGETDTRWRKLAVFGDLPNELSGTALFLDLDLIVVGGLDAFFEVTGAFWIIRDDNLFRPKPLRKLNPKRDRFHSLVGNSSVFRFEIGAHKYILDSYLSDMDNIAVYENEQQYLTAKISESHPVKYWPRDWCVSFKNDCVPRLFTSYLKNPSVPHGARIVVFAGLPKIHDVLAGRGGRWYRRIGNVDFINGLWSDPLNYEYQRLESQNKN